jgi:drug/metabolite transporter (DMT)-like permease
MTGLALLLIVLAAVCHAVWNLAAKRSGGGLPFIFLAGLVINVLYLPVLAIYFTLRQPVLGGSMIFPIVVSALLKTGYAIYLQRSYRSGDFSLVYPLARGSGPLLAMFLAVVFLGERPSWIGFFGATLIVLSIFLLTGGERLFHRHPAKTSRGAALAPAIRNGLVTGAFIASYTVWDRYGVAHQQIPPVIFDAGTAFAMTTLLAPFGWRLREQMRQEWKLHRPEVLTMAILSPLGYVLVLTAMTFTPVSYVAPARELSILFGALLGARYLKEAEAPRRLWAATGMVAGLAILALA